MRVFGAIFLSSVIGVGPGFSADSAIPNTPPPPASAKETPPNRSASEETEPSIDQLIADLSSDDYKAREDATQKLWRKGREALDGLRKAAGGTDPESAFRAAGLIRNIDNEITPDSDPKLVELVEKYHGADREEKADILIEIRKLKGWSQLLKLYSTETDPAILQQFSAQIHLDAIIAAREKLMADKPEEARRFLEMAPQDAQSMMALAAFYRSQGTLNAELEKVKTKTGREAALWRSSIYRALGDIPAARKDAIESSDQILAGAMALLDGDPLPWFKLHARFGEENPIRAFYMGVVSSQWMENPKDLPVAAIDPLIELLEAPNEENRIAAANTLFLLGEPGLAEEAFLKAAPLDAATYFESTERIPEVFGAFGLDPNRPDFGEWAKTRFERVIKEEDDGTRSATELAGLASVMSQLGMTSELQTAFEVPLLKIAEENEDTFLTLLQQFFTSERSNRSSVGLARNAGAKWAAEDAGRWHTLVETALNSDETVMQWWEWTAALDPKASLADRFDGLLAMLELTPDPKRLNQKWLDLAWAAAEKAEEGQQARILKLIGFMANPSAGNARSGNLALSMKVWDKLPAEGRGDPIDNFAYIGLAAANRWDEAAQLFEKMIQRDKENGSGVSRVFLHAYAASSHRRAGHEKEAAAHDDMVEKLTLSDEVTAAFNAEGYLYGGDWKRADLWLKRSAYEATPEREGYEQGLVPYADRLLEEGKWKQAAAINEAMGLKASGMNLNNPAPFPLLNLRLKADLPHALSLLETDRPRALAMLARCYAMLPGGGILADNFFPAVRKAGLIKEHDQWFESSWKVFADLIEQYPASDHLKNGAAWTAARSTRRLDEAEKFATEALKINPDQGAYLDTMAEVQFAKGDRKAALKWSAEAINFTPVDPAIRRQYERFATNPLPQD